MLNLNDREWKAFKISSLFKIVSGRDINLDNNLGGIPYVNSSGVNNGITQFINKYKVVVENCITIARTGTVGATFYQKNKVAISGNIRALIPVDFILNQAKALFLIQAIKNTTTGRFSYGKILGTERITNLKILLPIADDERPDYAFMEQYIKEREDKLKQKYIDFVNAEFSTPPIPLEEKEWRAFKVKHIFTIEKCKCSSVSTLKQGNFPYVGATNRNNGIMSFVEKKDQWVTKGNGIVFICDGQGSVGYSIYKKEDFIGSTTLKLGRNEHLNRYISQFFVGALDKNRQMYSYGYKRNENRLCNESIMLPITNDGQPDYEYMEQYIKAVMFGKYKKYLEYQKCPDFNEQRRGRPSSGI